MVWILIGIENIYLSIDCTKIRNNPKQTEISRNEVMQATGLTGTRTVILKRIIFIYQLHDRNSKVKK